MAALPKRRQSTRRQGKRRAAIKVKPVPLYPCPNCGRSKLSHQVCPNCGQYKGKLVVEIKKEKDEKGNRSAPPKKERSG